jgi:hypothetical protein
MSRAKELDLFTTRKGQAYRNSETRKPAFRLLVVCLAVLIGALLVTACGATTAPDDELGNGFGPYGIAHMVADEELGNGFGPYGIAHMVADEELGNGYGPYGIAHLVTQDGGDRRPKVTCAELYNDPVFSTSSPAEAEQFEYECVGSDAAPLAASQLQSETTSVACVESHDDPAYSASSLAEAEYLEFQCTPGGAAVAGATGEILRQ